MSIRSIEQRLSRSINLLPYYPIIRSSTADYCLIGEHQARYASSGASNSSRSSSDKHDRLRSDKALMEELGRLTQRQPSDSITLGPFIMPGGSRSEKELRTGELDSWGESGWLERLRRTLRLGRNLMIVGFGGSLGILIIYSIVSELFAPSSATNLMNLTIEVLESSKELKKILKPPFKYHTSIQTTSKSHDSNVTTIRFWVECIGEERSIDWTDLDWWKSLISPLITSETYQHPKTSAQSVPEQDEDSKGSSQRSFYSGFSWILPGLVKGLMPMTIDSSIKHSNSKTLKTPRLGSFQRGKVIAEFSSNSDGKRNQKKLKSLIVDFPDSEDVRFRLDVLRSVRLQKQSHRNEEDDDDGGGKGTTRYRFWSRRV
ncbi:hypothetical protein BY996DRAFT_4585361 [Phakopsora pachyrhizi]|nr:hypothetical protein BY996DRAFT_4585361 [Phakopsora pachyrhizi]